MTTAMTTAMAPSQVLDLDAIDVQPGTSTSSNSAPLFTCLSCSIGYPNPEDQRAHYRTDLHRYNMKRRVANLPPIRADAFDAKIIQQRGEEEKKSVGGKEDRCQMCQKSFSSLNAYQSHVASKKHRDNENRLRTIAANAIPPTSEEGADPLVVVLPASSALDTVLDLKAALPAATANDSHVRPPRAIKADLRVSEDATEEEIQAAIDAKVATTKRIDPETSCLFCSITSFTSLDDSLDHMTRHHGFFVPEQTYLTDRTGLMKYLADKICIGNMCLYCNGRGRGFLSGEAARKHMIDKSHCKVAYESEEDRLELSDFYDFTSSYPDAQWEDVSDEEADELGAVSEDGNEEDDLPDDSNQARYGDNEFELVLPSGVRLGHRSLRRYYNQSLRPTGSAYNSASGSQVAHRLNGSGREQRDELMVQNRGGNAVRARNRGEAREAKKHISTYRDSNKREQYKTQIGYRNNSQKHFRDPLLQ